MRTKGAAIVAVGALVLLAFSASRSARSGSSAAAQHFEHAAHGRQLIASYGCLACHEISGFEGLTFRGPRLDNSGAKLQPEWLHAWLTDPQAVSSRSRMGNFRLDAEEINDVAAFLLSQQVSTVTAAVDWRHTDPAAGRALFASLRCTDCHGAGDEAATSASALGGIGGKVRRDWLAAFLEDPQSVQPGTPMSRYALTPSQIGDLAAFLLVETKTPVTGLVPATAADTESVAEGRLAFERHGCARCHQLAGVKDPGRVGPALWVRTDASGKVLWPDVSAPSPRMPVYSFTGDEVADIDLVLRVR